MVSLELATRFQPMNLNPNAALQFADTLSEAFVIVLWESKEDLVGWNLTRHSMITVAQVLAHLDHPDVRGPSALTLSGHPAIQYEIRGASQGTRIAYLHTSVESPIAFAQVLAWSRASEWQSMEESLRAIAGSITVAWSAPTVSTDIHDVVQGTWAWESESEPCTGLTQRFVVSEDREAMKIHHSEPIESTTGETTTVTDYAIEGAGPRVLHTFIPGESRLTADGQPVKWDLVAIGRNRIAWHRTDWPEGAYTGMLRRCD